jgi:hypothetical protein
MTDEDRKAIARLILSDPYDSEFHRMDYEELQDFYNVKCRCEVVPTTARCARDEARRILGEPESSRLTLRSLRKR